MISAPFAKLAAFVCEHCLEVFVDDPMANAFCAGCGFPHILCGACKFIHELSTAKQDHYLNKVIG